MTYKEYFKDKKIAFIGIGPHGEMISDIKFLLRNKVDFSLYDIRSEKRMKDYLQDLIDFGLIKYSFGKIDEDELLNYDLIIISPEISKKSSFLKKPIQKGIEIYYPDILFFKLSPPITLIGVMGLYGKTYVTNLMYSILKNSFSEYESQGLFLINPDSNSGILSHLKKIKKDDVVLARIPDKMLSEYYDVHISPHVAIITTVTDFSILNFQTYNNFIVATDEAVDAMKSDRDFISKAKMLRTRKNMVPVDWYVKTRANHDLENIALVIQASELFKVKSELIRDSVLEFPGIKGSVEFVKKVSNIEYYNDANSSNPKSTLSALRSLQNSRNLILILGGAYTGHDYIELLKELPQYVYMLILLPGSGSLGIRSHIEKLNDVIIEHKISLELAIDFIHKNAKKGDRVLFSPAFDAVGIDISRKDRSDKFVRIVKNL